MSLFTLPSRIIRLAKESSWIIAGQVFSVVGSLILIRILTEYLKPAQYGELALGLTLAGLVNQVLMGGVIASAGRFYSIAAEKSDLPSYFAATKSLVADATLALAGMTLLLIFGMYWYGYTHWLTFTIVVLVFAASTGNSALLNSIQNAARLRALVASHSCLDPWLKLVLLLDSCFGSEIQAPRW
ncbi:hypothetical protein [Candidatus Aalborgicola defluviihabitans]|uniref:hypothetical protein n=1 Tax=Candidatus Aalborgicola defluviihabitans TaxID=3386187 RepID=UPI0039B8939B